MSRGFRPSSVNRLPYLAYWRGLVDAALAGAADPVHAHAPALRAWGHDAPRRWVLPSDNPDDAAICAALAATAYAFGRLSGPRRAECAPALGALARQVGEILDGQEGSGPKRPAVRPEPPARPYRADIDG